MKVNIYCLYDPLSCKIRYIGRTRKSLQVRLVEHISKSKYYSIYFPNKSFPHKVNWINSLLAQNIEPKIKLLTQVDGWKESYKFEIELIGKYKNKLDLTNAQDRGEGKESRITSIETRKLISKTLKDKHDKNEIKRKTTKVYVFDKFGNLSDEKESITELSKSLNISYSTLKKKLKSGRSVNGLFISTSSILQIDKYLFIYNPINNRFLLFSTIQEVLSFLNISDFVYKKLEKSKSSKDGWLINTVTEINNSKLTLTKNGIDYEFFSVKEAANFIGCVVFAIYDLLKGKTKSIYNFKLKEQ